MQTVPVTLRQLSCRQWVYILDTVQQENHKGTITFAKNSVAGYRGWVKKGNAKAKYEVAKPETNEVS